MADEWNYATFSFDYLTEDRSDILDHIDAFLTQVGWEVVPWNASQSAFAGGDLGAWGVKFYRRTDHATSDVWHYEGDGPTQRSLIYVVDHSTDGVWGFGTALENASASNVQVLGDWDQALKFSDPAEDAEFLLMGGEYGIYVEGGVVSNPVLYAHGFIASFIADAKVNGTLIEERKWSSQGIQCHLMGELPFILYRNYRKVLNDGLSSNKSTTLFPHVARGSASLLVNTQVDDIEHSLGCWDNFFGCNGQSTSGDFAEYSRYSWGLLSTPFDERYRVSPMMLYQNRDDFEYDTTSSSTSTSNNIAAYASGNRWLDPRWARVVPKFAAMGHLLIPWTTIEDSEGTEWRIARVDDNGRQVSIGIEWPGPTAELTV